MIPIDRPFLAAGLAIAIAGRAFLSAQSPPARRAATPPTSTRVAAIASIKEIMDGIVDPAAEALFDAVAYNVTAAGVEETKPTTDEEWAHVRRNALLLAESTNLLKMPGRRVAPQNPFLELEKDDVLPDDLTPAQVQVLIDRDPAAFNRLATELAAAAMLALKAADAKDVDALFESGDAIDRACENCHMKYWYPKEKPAR